MLTESEISSLTSILDRARRAAGRDRTASADTITPGDVVQLRPGSSRTWETSFLLVGKVLNGRIRGAILRPHRSGCPEAWSEFSAPELARVGRAPYPEPPLDVRSWCYAPACPLALRKPPASEGAPPPSVDAAQAIERDHRAAVRRQLADEQRQVEHDERARAIARRRKTSPRARKPPQSVSQE